ncbi:hypothetical protein PVAP13_8KG228401 [Panicum virgatum]|uniref:Uncharacterized protein n=1 Tax=Panicum virgatum TaxID=38727 RepID=A0A8T0PKX4_PANVG|nr:hypothetical protein PVAP13_8KG228401 [Panicum virgatum]
MATSPHQPLVLHVGVPLTNCCPALVQPSRHPQPPVWSRRHPNRSCAPSALRADRCPALVRPHHNPRRSCPASARSSLTAAQPSHGRIATPDARAPHRRAPR